MTLVSENSSLLNNHPLPHFENHNWLGHPLDNDISQDSFCSLMAFLKDLNRPFFLHSHKHLVSYHIDPPTPGSPPIRSILLNIFIIGTFWFQPPSKPQ